MAESGFHFVAPLWLLLLPVPLLTWLWLRTSRVKRNIARYRNYAHGHLLPHLLGQSDADPALVKRRFIQWSVVWTLLVLAIATPRWDYVDMQLFRPGSDVIILLDLSRSMDADDVAPSRLARARQEIEDLIRGNRYSRIGLIGFATVAHVISPLTEDRTTLERQLPALSTNLVRYKGSRVTEALARARQMLAGQPDDSSKHLILITDGDYGDQAHIELARELSSSGMHLHVIGVGTADGATVPGRSGTPMRHPRYGLILSKLDETALSALADAGGGLYRRAAPGIADTEDILAQIANDSQASAVAEEKTRIWREQFFWPAGLAALVILPLFRRIRSSGASL